jgi:hypothetical protein
VASTAKGTQLTEQHRTAQLAVRAAAARELIDLWSLLNPLDLDATAAAWLRQTLALILRRRTESVQRSTTYYAAFKTAETGEFGTPHITLPDVPHDPIITSLTVTGPIKVKQLTARGETAMQAARMALPEVTRAATRHVLNGGRGFIEAAVEQDRTALGWARVTDGDPCAFCAMLASRGPAYKSRDSALETDSGQRYHDGCSCVTEPQFHRDQPWPGKAREFSDLWAKSTAGHSGGAALNAFRRAYEAQRSSA